MFILQLECNGVHNGIVAVLEHSERSLSSQFAKQTLQLQAAWGSKSSDCTTAGWDLRLLFQATSIITTDQTKGAEMVQFGKRCKVGIELSTGNPCITLPYEHACASIAHAPHVHLQLAANTHGTGWPAVAASLTAGKLSCKRWSQWAIRALRHVKS